MHSLYIILNRGTRMHAVLTQDRKYDPFLLGKIWLVYILTVRHRRERVGRYFGNIAAPLEIGRASCRERVFALV